VALKAAESQEVKRIRRMVSTRRRIAALSLAVGCALSLATITAPVAQAASSVSPQPLGWADGDVTNRLSAAYTVKIAVFGTGTQTCDIWNSTDFKCVHWWLPSGQADDQIRGSNFDTDGFMVESNYRVIEDGVTYYVGARRWTRISNGENVNCYYSGGPICSVSGGI
jgi:hypothetical protein